MSRIKLSKKLCYVLRHNPASIGLLLDKNGYAASDELITKFNKSGTNIDMAILTEIVESDEKTRFSFNKDKTKIRANYGHSFEVDLDLMPTLPPSVLYHGTAERNVVSILENGLNKAKRNFVHLTDDVSVALSVGSRYGNAVLFKVDSDQMISDGFVFYKSRSVWLTDYVPAKYLHLTSAK